MPKKGFPKEIDRSNNNYKVGDRIFCEVYGFDENHKLICTGISTDIITGIRKGSYEDEATRENWRDTGTIVHHNVFETVCDSLVEDYNCLPYDDPRVIEFCKGKKLCGLDLMDKLRQFLTENGAFPGDRVVVGMLDKLTKEYDG